MNRVLTTLVLLVLAAAAHADEVQVAVAAPQFTYAKGQPLLARLTRRSAAAPRLAADGPVWAQIKAVALIG